MKKQVKISQLTRRLYFWVFLLSLWCPGVHSAQNPFVKAKVFSTAGFYPIENSGRSVFDFNAGWRFFKGNVAGAEKPDFKDQSWEVVALPHGLELLPQEASGCKNYQGPAWYRKRFTIPSNLAGKKIFLHFEAIQGKSKIWFNGTLVKENYSGYLPVIIDLTAAGAKVGTENILSVLTDNSDDPNYPPGKPQAALDFVYFGGIYRDSWLIAENMVHVTDANFVNKVAGGGVFVHYPLVSDAKAQVAVETDVVNESTLKQEIKLETILRDANGTIVAKKVQRVLLNLGESKVISQVLEVVKPNLWHPDQPYLYSLYTSIRNNSDTSLDGFYQKIGIRKIEFRGKEGFFLNNKPFGDKLIGGNRHQDYAMVGNALPNTGQWRDAKKLRDAGMRVIRTAHYPMDPAFMDACDELGMFVIISTPGWQFWNNDSQFSNRIFSNTQNLVRRDRNRASILMWEPILNETRYPDTFAKASYDLVHAEYPYQGCYCACDINTKGYEMFDVWYSHPFEKLADYDKIDKCIFTREWGDNVDDWGNHNSPSRVARGWGELPQLIQAKHYGNPSYPFTSWQMLYQMPIQHIGGCLWHPFDHQRGYHPDPFLGGIMDAFRQPKYSYYLFQSQMNPKIKHTLSTSGYNLFIANEMTPFSPYDVTVYTNCDEVKLVAWGKDTLVQKVPRELSGMPNPPVVFKNVFDFMKVKELHRRKRLDLSKIEAFGLVDGKVVATFLRRPGKRSDQIVLTMDNDGIPLVADG